MKKQKIFYVAVMCLPAFVSIQCSPTKKDDKTAENKNSIAAMPTPATAEVKKSTADMPRLWVSPEFTNQIKRLFDVYLTIKNALVADNMEQATAAAFKAQLEKMNANGQSEEAKTLLGKAQKDLAKQINDLVKAPDIEGQRTVFAQVSDGMYTLIGSFGLGGIEAYRLFCPMALDEKGAHWLSIQKEVENPYFGKKMLRCGELQTTIK